MNQFDVLDLKMPQNGTPPKMRVDNARQASEIVSTLIKADEDRTKVAARVKGMLDGNPPYSQPKLEATGQANRTNINFRESEAILDAALTPYYDLFAEATSYFQVKCEYGSPNESIEHSKVVTEEFDRALKLWSGFDFNMQLCIHDFGAYGRGFLHWPDNTNWQPDAIRDSRVKVPDGTLSDMDKLELLVILEDMPVHKLWGYVKNKSAASRMGWNYNAALEEIKNAWPDQADSSTLDYEYIQQQLRNNDLYSSVRCRKIPVGHVFVKEFDNKITHLIVPRRDGNIGRTGNSEDVKFLYKKQGRYESFRQVVSPIFFNIGDGTWHSIKGLLIKIYPFIEIKNRLSCSTVDNGFLRSSILIQPKTENVKQRTALMQVGAMTILPSSAEFDLPQLQLGGSLEETLILDRALDNKLSSNIGMYRPTVRKEQGNPDTATKVLADQAKEAMLNKGSVNRFYAQMDFVGEEMFRRISNTKLTEDNGGPNSQALEFQKRCKDRGVPVQALKNAIIRAFRNIGNGSIFMRKQSIVELMPWVGMMNEAGKQNLLDDVISVTANQDFVSRYNPKTEEGTTAEEQRAEAMIENGVLKVGAPVTVTANQNDVIHAQTHLMAASQAAASLQQGANPGEVVAYLHNVGTHTASHLQRLAGNETRSGAFKLLQGQWKELAKLTNNLERQLQAQADEQAQMQEQAQTQITEEGLKRMQLEMDNDRKNRKLDADMQRKDTSARQKLVINDALAASKIVNSSRQ